MLITNFAAGELSKTLFGRTDLPQYYSGAARMENFDVIPTGGIRRRCGTERLKKLTNGEGRIIPFVVNRDLGFLLYLTPLKITVYKLVKGQIPADGVKGPFACNYQSDEIGEVQYAQNFDTMVLCHENRPPLEVKLENGELKIKQLAISFKKTVVAGEGTATHEFTGKANDETYDNGRLTQDGHYPAAVCFYNGRLVFAATKNEQQRLFVSAIKEAGKNYNFATNKVFLTERKEYIVVRGDVDLTEEIERKEVIIETEEGLKFSKPLEDYFFESPFYLPETRVVQLQGNRLKTSHGARLGVALTQAIKDDLANIERRSLGFDGFPTSGEFAVTEYTVAHLYDPQSRPVINPECTVTVGATSIKLRVKGYIGEETGKNSSDKTYTLPKEIAKTYNDGNTEVYKEFIAGLVQRHFEGTRIDQENLNSAVNALKNRSLETMQYHLVSGEVDEWYYDFAPVIRDKILRRYDGSENIYIPLYTREIIADEYPTPDCGFTFEIASDTNDAIRWLAVNKGLIVGTETGEWIIPPDVHATNQQAMLNSRYGSDRIQGAAVGDATCFFQTGKKSLVEYYIPQQDSNFRRNDMAMLNPEILNESDALEFDYIASPHTKLLITRADGTMAALLYERGTGTFAWGRITTGEGKIKSAAVLPGPDGNDEAYLLVRRGENDYLEKLREGGEAGVYLDSWTKVEESTWEEVRGGYEGEGVRVCRIDRGVYKAGHPFVRKERPSHEELAMLQMTRHWDPPLKKDPEHDWVAFQDARARIWAEIDEYNARGEGGDAAGGARYEGMDAEPDWTKEGEYYIGHAYKSVLRTMPVLDNDQMKKQNIVNIFFRFLNSYAPRITSVAGGRVRDTNEVIDFKAPYTGIKRVSFPGTWDEEVQAEISTDAPAPVTILSLNAEMAQGAQR